MRLRFLVPAAVACLATGLLHCGSDMPAVAGKDAGKDAIALPEPDAGTGTDADAAAELPPPPPPPPGCPGNVLPTENECMVHESYGVFVSASKGSPSGDGSRTSPLKSVSAAIAAAKSSGRRVYACAETYDEVLTLADGIAVFGYFDCASSWKVGVGRATIAPKTEGVAARAASIGKPTRIEGFQITAANATTPGGSSIGLIAQDAGGLSFFDVGITAGTAMAGEDGTAAAGMVQSGLIEGKEGQAQALGVDFDNITLRLYTTAPSGGVSQCVGSVAVNGGAGGAGGTTGRWSPMNLLTNTPCTPTASSRVCRFALLPGYTRTNGNPRPATAQTAQGASDGEVAANGTEGNAGANGANGGLGNLGPEGYQPANGTAGTHGGPGQGGGGGSGLAPTETSGESRIHWGVVGAGGGAGGCPGLAGTAGKGGGASVAVLALRSPMHFDAKSLLGASSGGVGGRGTDPAPATPGGAPGANPSGLVNAAGGAGGAGGTGGYSGHGGSGPSFGVAWTGTEPVVEATPTVAEPAPGQPALMSVPATAPGLAAPRYAL